MDKRIANNVSLGIFVFVGFLCFIFLLFKIGDGKTFMSSQITLYGKYRHVKGLHTGSEVSLSGLRVGVVKGISISDGADKELIVEMSVNREFQERIREDSVAAIVTQGVLGDKYIELSIGSPDFKPLEDESFITTHEESDIWSKGNKLLKKLEGKLAEGGGLEKLFGNFNQLMDNLVAITNDIRTGSGLANELVYGTGGKRLNKSLAHLEGIFRKINKGEGTLGALINDPTLYEDMKYLMGGAKRSTVLKYFMRQFIDGGANAEAKEEKKQ